MVFDHSTTSILLNMGLISTLLISLGFFFFSTDEFTAEEWKKKIKIIAEVATTNLKKNRERLESGAEDVESNNNPVETGAEDDEAVREEIRDSCGWREV